MGTDIHGFVQHKQDGVWVDSDFAGYEDRNYLAFAILADVRNGYGFAGCYRHEPLTPIQSGRGLPADLQDKIEDERYSGIQDEYGPLWLGDHSHGYVTLKELLEFNWKQTLSQGGVLTLQDYINWDKKSEPESYCGGVGGPGVRVMTPEEADARGVLPQDHSKLYVQCKWEQPVGVAARYFMEWIKALADRYHGTDPSNVRFVFGFDS